MFIILVELFYKFPYLVFCTHFKLHNLNRTYAKSANTLYPVKTHQTDYIFENIRILYFSSLFVLSYNCRIVVAMVDFKYILCTVLCNPVWLFSF